MAVSEGELLAIDRQTPIVAWDDRPIPAGPLGPRQRWITDGLWRRPVPNDAAEQFLRNDILDDQPPYPAAAPGKPGSSVESQGLNWTLLQAIPLAT